ncbi:MAG TPA: helix-hairpin-helix domain-containing protein [Bryobacteraceae bacterium]|nr:helix-hairpin-helix domain-containing protein [Bryobacteraceae bacterium]
MRNGKLAVGLIFSTALSLLAAGWQDTELPEGKGKETVQRLCSACHEITEVTAARYTETGWRRTVDDMISRGAEGSADEMDEVVAYLAKYFGRINVNTASRPQLQGVLGLPEKEAQAIIAYREHNGNIRNLDQLKSVPGVNAQRIQEKSTQIAFSQ